MQSAPVGVRAPGASVWGGAGGLRGLTGHHPGRVLCCLGEAAYRAVASEALRLVKTHPWGPPLVVLE